MLWALEYFIISFSSPLLWHIRPPAASQSEATTSGPHLMETQWWPIRANVRHVSLLLSLLGCVCVTSHDPERLWPGLGWVLWCWPLPPHGPAGWPFFIRGPAPHGVGRGPVCFRNSHRHRERHRRHHHPGHAVPARPRVPAADQPGPGGPPGRRRPRPPVPLRFLCGAQWLVGAADLGTAGDVADRLALQPDGRGPGPVPVSEPRPHLRVGPVPPQSRGPPAAGVAGRVCDRSGARDGLALPRGAGLLLGGSTPNADIPVAAVWGLPGGCHGHPAALRRDLPRGKAARPRHRHPEALPDSQPLICKPSQQWAGLLPADPGAQCVCGLLDAILPLGAVGRRLQPPSVHLCHLGASSRQLPAEPHPLQPEKQRHPQGAASGLLPPQMPAQRTDTLPSGCVDCTTSPVSDRHTIYARHITVCVPRYTHCCIDCNPDPHTPTHTGSTSMRADVLLQIRMYWTVLKRDMMEQPRCVHKD